MLSTGTKLGPYEIVSPLGAGGMGEVYRARDTKLRRDVALKILPEAFAADPERRARFTREAHVLASLNHPNIAAIYGIEETGEVTALVMELVDGRHTRQSVARGDARPDSDIDILIVVRADREPTRLERRAVDVAFDVNLQHDVYISPRVLTASMIADPVWGRTPFLSATAGPRGRGRHARGPLDQVQSSTRKLGIR